MTHQSIRAFFISKLSYRLLELYARKNRNNAALLTEVLAEVCKRVDVHDAKLKEAIADKTYSTSKIRNQPDPKNLRNKVRHYISILVRIEDETSKRDELLKSAVEREKEFPEIDDKSRYFRIYDDGETDTSRFEHDVFLSSINLIQKPEMGKVYELPPRRIREFGISGRNKVFEFPGRRCLCIHPWVSYGGGSLALWAVEGDSAQLTLRRQSSGYIVGKCLKISKRPVGITFQPQSAHNGWPDIAKADDPKKIEARFLKIDDIARYDRNFGWSWPEF